MNRCHFFLMILLAACGEAVVGDDPPPEMQKGMTPPVPQRARPRLIRYDGVFTVQTHPETLVVGYDGARIT